jgi:hypothetical protein
LFTVLYLVGAFWFEDDPRAWRRPFRSAGALGLAGLCLLLTFEEPWRHVGWKYYRHDPSYDSAAAIADYVLTGGLFVWAVALLVIALRRGQRNFIPFGVAPLLAMAGFVASAGADDPVVPWLLFNAYVFGLSVFTLAQGIRASRMRTVNEGMLLLSALIVFRFFDSDLPLAARGLAFIVVGAGFLGANLAMAARKRKAGS